MNPTAAILAGWLALAQATPPPAAARASWSHSLTGSFRSLLTTSRSFATDDRYADSLNRLRLALAGGRGYAFSYRVELDSQTNLGTRVEQPDFAVVRHRQDLAWLDLLHVVGDAHHGYLDVSVYRASATLRSSRAALTIGRQRIAWGTARFWSPADLFNPIDPLQIEGDIRQGVDAVAFEGSPVGRWRSAAVYAPQDSFDRSTLAARLGTTAGEWDAAAFGGRFGEDWVGGTEAEGQWAGAGLRGELTYHWRGSSSVRNALRLSAGADYAFAKTYFVGEYFYNQGQPSCDLSSAACRALVLTAPTTELFTRHRHFFSGGATYVITPLVKAETYVVFDVVGTSAFVSPIVRYNAWTNVDLAIGGQLSVGSTEGEFHGLPALFFAQFDVHF